ncbi:LANO_0D02564g1_1 [Lachancea nothofagi CBS 11611]|uniref:Sensitive to high expression protein 9, mitochondrial n=1 Tax=Lachancea nothofagi CBS 11611 TaxID=1266666 RepID=A0A1G4JEF5_9SACH|nr:LANO_0D02564g1_1 [Lachancea nothofagi CBS 11611]
MFLRPCLLVRCRVKAPKALGIRLYSNLKDNDKPRPNPIMDNTKAESLNPYLSTIRQKWAISTKQLKHFSSQVKKHADKAKLAIQEANQKLLAAEQKEKDNRLGFDTDVETKGRIEGLPSERERSRTRWAKKLEFYFDSLQETIFTATRALNDVTGYSSIQKLRKSIELMERQLETTKLDVRNSKLLYNAAIEVRAKSQSEVSELLQRKNSWSPQDLERFTLLYKDDSLNSKREEEAKNRLQEVEAREEELSDSLYRAILTRYHEEQIWSDKIRRTSTWGTFILMGMNILLFLVFQLLLEPWKRRRLVGSFEDKVKLALDEQATLQSTRLTEMSDYISTSLDKNAYQGKQFAMTETITPDKSPQQNETIFQGQSDLRSLEKYWPYLPHIIARQLANLSIWTQNFVKKLYQIPKKQLDATSAFTTVELYVYGMLFASIGYATSALL